jgi:hypothetical protein|tara:strand:- start:82 stop:681 length:600 start_codon:yes stop_codon:yes gene_type:complete
MRKITRYMMWKQPLHKWDTYIQNKHKQNKQCDSWSKYILTNLMHGDTVVYNCGGLYFTDFQENILVVENKKCPVNTNKTIYMPEEIPADKKFNNLIMINPITLKYNFSVSNFLTMATDTRGGLKPCLVNWLTQNNKIFLSFSDWVLYFDRLRYTVTDMVDMQIHQLEKNNFKCIFSEVGDVNQDTENGNIKLVLQYNNI